MSEGGSGTEQGHKFSRRQALKYAAVGVGALALGEGIKIGVQSLEDNNTIPTTPVEKLPIQQPLSVIEFPPIADPKDMEASSWDADTFRDVLHAAIRESMDTNQLKVVELPEGEILINEPIESIIPEGAQVTIRGHENGTRLRLSPDLSDVPKEWGSFAKRSILYFRDMEGLLQIEGIDLHGGSDRAGQGGYEPPLSPWDSTILVVGKGVGEVNGDGYRPGEQYDPAMDQAGNRHGKVTVKDCNFFNSESEGFMAQNLGEVEVRNIRGKNLDVLVNAAWCDDVKADNVLGERMASDGFYITSAQRVELENCDIKTARQGYDLQGVKDAVLRQCHAHDCGKAYELTLSETDKKTVTDAVTLIDCATDGCMEVLSIGPVNSLQVDRMINKGVGNWYSAYQEGEYLHRDGIRHPEWIAGAPSPINLYTLEDYKGDPITGQKILKFKDVQIQIGGGHPEKYSVPQLDGITYSRVWTGWNNEMS